MYEWSIRNPSRFGWLVAGVFVLIVLGLALELTDGRPAGAACQGSFKIDFAGLAHGTVIDNQYADRGVQVSVQANEGFPDEIIVFDTNRPPTHDPDLAVNVGNIAILAKNLTDSNHDGLIDDPDENDFGGKVTITFDQDVSIGSFVFVDHDHQPADFAAAYDANGGLIAKVLIPVAADGSVQTVNVDANGVRRFELVYRDSGGFTGIEVTCASATVPTPTPTSQGATATPTTPAGVTATPTTTPLSGGQSTPTIQPTVAAATPTPAVQAVRAAATPAATAPSAVLAAVSGPGAQGFPVTGDRPDDGDLSRTALPITLAGTLVALAGGALLMHAQRRRAAQPATSSSTSVRRPNAATRSVESTANDFRSGGLTRLIVVGLYAAVAIAGLFTRPHKRD